MDEEISNEKFFKLLSTNGSRNHVIVHWFGAFIFLMLVVQLRIHVFYLY